MEPTAAAGVATLGIFMLIPIGLGIAFAVFWLLSVIDVTKNDFINPNNKTMWLILLLIMAPVGTLLYQIIGKDQKVKTQATGNGQETADMYIATRVKSNKDDNGGKWM